MKASVCSTKKQLPIESLVAVGTCTEGKTRFSNGLGSDGKVIGGIWAKDHEVNFVATSESATVTGHVYADYAIINGRVKGPVHASELVELSLKVCIEGDVSYKALEMQ